jgi:hypothetical protein
MMALPVEMPRRDFVDLVYGPATHSMPVYHGTMDEIVGVAHLKGLGALRGFARWRWRLSEYSLWARQGEMVNLMPWRVKRRACRKPSPSTRCCRVQAPPPADGDCH